MPRKPSTPPLSDLARTPHASAHAKLSRRQLYRLAEEGQIGRYKVGGATYWSLTELDALVTRSRVSPSAVSA